MLSVSVVVPVLNAARTLPACLDGLARLDPAPMEIILVDNGSTDESLSLLQAFAGGTEGKAVRVLQESRRGAAAARNAGIRLAKGDVVAFTDADCAPDTQWLQFLVASFADPVVGAAGGRVVSAPAASTLELFSALYTLQLPDRAARHRIWTPWEGGYPTANLMVRRQLLEELGSFDESLQTGEDYDLCARLYERGAEVVYVPESRVAHHHRTSFGGMVRQGFGIGRAHPCLLRRHAGNGLWLELPRRLVIWRKCPVRGWLDLASADKKMLAILILGALSPLWLLALPLYGVWLTIATARRARQAGVAVSGTAAATLAGMLLLKSAAMTAGRWWGTIEYGALCL